MTVREPPEPPGQCLHPGEPGALRGEELGWADNAAMSVFRLCSFFFSVGSPTIPALPPDVAEFGRFVIGSGVFCKFPNNRELLWYAVSLPVMKGAL